MTDISNGIGTHPQRPQRSRRLLQAESRAQDVIILAPSPSSRFEAICPYLGLNQDRQLRFATPHQAHHCYAQTPSMHPDQTQAVSLNHQDAYCFSQQFGICPHYGEPATVLSSTPTPSQLQPKVARWRLGLWAIAGVLLVFVGISTLRPWLETRFSLSPPVEAVVVTSVTALPTATHNALGEDIEALVLATPTATQGVNQKAVLPTPSATPTATANGRIYTLSAQAADVGWVVSSETQGNHFGDSFLYTGIFQGQVYHSAFQFDLSTVPRGAPIHQASIQLTGLRDDRLGHEGGGTWLLRLLSTVTDEDWRRHNYQTIFNATTLQTLSPFLSSADLVAGQTNHFDLSTDQIKELESRIIADESPTVSFRLDGPLIGEDNLFAWDTGFGSQSQGNRVMLFLHVGSAPATPPPFDFVVVTSTPTPENVMTAAALVRQMTVEAVQGGTSTPTPANVVTATPFPEYLVIKPTSTAGNVATAQAIMRLATAQALTTGTATPFPRDAVTVTPTATGTATPTFVMITSTPTSSSIFAAATQVAFATQQVYWFGTPTPLPQNWVTPIVITPTPTPANEATSEVLAQMATAQAFTTGTPTPLPPNVVTATPTVYLLITSTPTPASVFAAATQVAAVTALSHQVGTTTPLPTGWVTPIVVTSTPTPANLATVQALAALATAQVFVYGSPTPTPFNLVTATATPVFIVLRGDLPEATATPTARPAFEQIPLPLLGKIAFKSDRSGEEAVYLMNPDGSGLALLTATWPYNLARQSDQFSANGRFRVFTKDAVRYKKSETNLQGFERDDAPALFWQDALYNVEAQLTHFGAGIAYDGVWSPTAEQIAFVSNDSQNDEIWVVNRDGSGMLQLTRNQWQWDKHPSWSPDGQQIAFWSNRTGTKQIWVMDAQGNNLHNLSQSPYNDWDPVWIKYPHRPQ